MAKEVKKLFPRILLFVSLMFLLNVIIGIYTTFPKNVGITGFSIQSVREMIENAINITLVTKIFLAMQWSLLLILVFYAFFRDKTITQTKKELQSVTIKKTTDKNKTDLDTLYEILMSKKTLRISTIAKAFNVSKEIATEWCRILESGGLIIIDYPVFSEPIVRINQEPENDKDFKKKGKKENTVQQGKEKEVEKDKQKKTKEKHDEKKDKKKKGEDIEDKKIKTNQKLNEKKNKKEKEEKNKKEKDIKDKQVKNSNKKKK